MSCCSYCHWMFAELSLTNFRVGVLVLLKWLPYYYLHYTCDCHVPGSSSRCVTIPVLYVCTVQAKSLSLPCSVNRSCRKGFRPCYNQRCVANSRFCDGIDDCGDNSDEAYCSSECRQPFDPPTSTQPSHLAHSPPLTPRAGLSRSDPRR